MDFIKFYEENNFKFDKNIAYGIYRERLMSFMLKNNYMKVTISFNILPNKEQGKVLSLKIRKIKEENRALQNGLTTNVAQELIIYKSAEFEKEFFDVLDKCLDAIDEIIGKNIEICPLCGKVMPSNSPFLRLKDAVIQAHEPCMDQLVNATNQMEKQMEVSNKKNIWKTILLCFLTMIIVTALMAVSVLIKIYDFVILFAGWLLFFIVRMLMNKFKMSFKKPELTIISIFSIVCVLLSVFFGSTIDIYTSEGIDLTYVEVVLNYFKIIIINFSNYGIFVLLDIVLSSLFVGISIFFNFKQFNATKQNIKKL